MTPTGPFGGAYMGYVAPQPKPDNNALMRRASQRGRHGQAPGALGEFFSDTAYQTLMTRGSAGQSGVMGPLTSPMLSADEPESVLSLLRDIRNFLPFLPLFIVKEWRLQTIQQPRESISFAAGSVSVTVPATSAVAVVQETIDDRFTGFLTHVGVNVIAPGSFPDIIWQIRVNGAVHPKFANRQFFTNTLATPMPFAFELMQSRTVQLVAINTSAAPIAVAGVLCGWTEFMADGKHYGSSPQTGIA